MEVGLFELTDGDAHFFGFFHVISSVSLEISEDLVRGATLDIHDKEVFGLAGVFDGFETERLEVFEGFLVVEATGHYFPVAVAFNKFVIGVDMEGVGMVFFKIVLKVLDEKAEKFGVFVVDERAARGVKEFLTEEGGFADQHGGSDSFAAILHADIVNFPTILDAEGSNLRGLHERFIGVVVRKFAKLIWGEGDKLHGFIITLKVGSASG